MKKQSALPVAPDTLPGSANGSATALVLQALSAQPASEQELGEIRRLIDDYRKTRSR